MNNGTRKLVRIRIKIQNIFGFLQYDADENTPMEVYQRKMDDILKLEEENEKYGPGLLQVTNSVDLVALKTVFTFKLNPLGEEHSLKPAA